MNDCCQYPVLFLVGFGSGCKLLCFSKPNEQKRLWSLVAVYDCPLPEINSIVFLIGFSTNLYTAQYGDELVKWGVGSCELSWYHGMFTHWLLDKWNLSPLPNHQRLLINRNSVESVTADSAPRQHGILWVLAPWGPFQQKIWLQTTKKDNGFGFTWSCVHFCGVLDISILEAG